MDLFTTAVQTAINAVIEDLVTTKARTATKYLSDKLTVKATRPLYQGNRFHKRQLDIVLTVGPPNYAERRFIKLCRKAGQAFPVRKVQLKYPPQKK